MENYKFIHFTANTGNTAVQTLNNFKPDTKTKKALSELAKKALQEDGVEIDSNTYFEAALSEDSYIGTVYAIQNGNKRPILVTGGATTKESGQQILSSIKSNFESIMDLSRLNNLDLIPPFVLDVVLPVDLSCTGTFMLSGMSGDFCRCMGWAYLFPEVLQTKVVDIDEKKNEGKIHVIIAEPNKPPRDEWVENKLECLQKIVGGNIEVVGDPYGNCIVANEFSLIENLPINKRKNGWYYYGTFFITSSYGEDFTSLSDSQIEFYKGIL